MTLHPKMMETLSLRILPVRFIVITLLYGVTELSTSDARLFSAVRL